MIAIDHAAGAAAGTGPAPGAARTEWLYFAATPTFATMALVTALLSDGSGGTLCSGMQHISALTGMLPMYVLMSLFHAGPWLRLILPRVTADQAAAARAAAR